MPARTGPGWPTQVEQLVAKVEAHLDYEEKMLLPVLGTLTAG